MRRRCPFINHFPAVHAFLKVTSSERGLGASCLNGPGQTFVICKVMEEYLKNRYEAMFQRDKVKQANAYLAA